jgi:hypothetical protein
MAIQSLRRYLTFEQLQGYQPSVVVEDNNILIEAEKDIDNIILSGANTGSRFAIRSNTSNVLTYFDTNALSTGTEAVKIYQFGKCPMIKDKNYIGSNYNKTISEQIKEAVAYQYVFRTENDINVKNPVTSYSVSQDSYSEHFAVDKPLSITERISPQAMDILGGLTIQTI